MAVVIDGSGVQKRHFNATRNRGLSTATKTGLSYNANHSCLRVSDAVRLSDVPKGGSAVVAGVMDAHADDAIAQRLRDLGFVAGERVRVAAVAPMGGDPILIQIGYTRFALRRAEAARVTVCEEVAA
jgi:ferrous iron transport protein A